MHDLLIALAFLAMLVTPALFALDSQESAEQE
jgi:hypothetical protein